MPIPPADYSRIEELYDQGLYLQAWDLLRAHEPLTKLQTADERILAGRVAGNLGAHQLASRLFLNAYRIAPNDTWARSFYVRTMLERRGPLAAWRLLRRFGDVQCEDDARAAEWMSLTGMVVGMLRDFDTADEWFARAEERAPLSPWVCVERSVVLERADRYEEALAHAQRALSVRPWYRPAVQSAAHLLQLVGRDDEAMDLLVTAEGHLESCLVVAERAALELELERYEEVRRSLDRFERLAPLAEKPIREWLAASRSDAAYHLGEIDEAIRLAREAGPGFFETVATRMEEPPAGARRVSLPVGFVRQHHLTCAPATLSAISRFWSMPADHLSVASEICYDGTPWHSERKWAEDHGWVAREFTITYSAARAVLDRGVPFTLTTVAPGYAHLQAVVGYDEFRGTLLIRDPYMRNLHEALAEEMIAHQKATGPRGMAMVPSDKAHLLEGLDLPDAPLWDILYRVERALQEHRRAEAWAAWEEIAAAADDHPLTIQSRRAIAAYDADVAAGLECAERLLQRFPEDANLEMARLAFLRDVSRREERLEMLRAVCARPVHGEEGERRGEAAPLFWQQYASELMADAREHMRAEALLERSLRRRPAEPRALRLLADILWMRRGFEDAAELYRFAACMEDHDEDLAEAYFSVSRHLHQTERALGFLRSRFERFASRSGHPARTLFDALQRLDRTEEGFEVLERGLALRPDDGELLLFAAEQHARFGRFDRAGELLAAAQGRCPQPAWIRQAAYLATQRGESQRALELWRQAVEAEPLVRDANEELARLLAQTEGPAAVDRHFEAMLARFPYHCGLLQLRAQWLRNQDDPAAGECVLRRLLEMNPADAWARRELAIALMRARRLDEAIAEAEDGVRLEPHGSYSHSVLGDMYSAAGRWESARDSYREAVRLSVDNDHAISQLLTLCDTPEQRRQALQFVEQELEQQTIYGDGLLAFRHYAQRTLPPDEVCALVQRALARRSDLWHAWSAMTNQWLEMDRLAEALETAQQATARFPLLPALWADLATVHRARGDVEAERAALRQALQIAPGYANASRWLADSYERVGDFAEGRRLLEAAIERDPLDGDTHAALAHQLWSTGQREAAIERLRTLLRVAPDYEWAWRALGEWCGELDRPGDAAEAARDLAARRPGDARSWLMLARVLGGPGATPERLVACDKALALSPRLVEAADLKARILAEEGRFEEAIAACRVPNGGAAPARLRLREAWIENRCGRPQRAIEIGRQVVTEEPNLYPAWLQLAEWYDGTGAHREYEQAAQRLTVLQPQEGQAWALLGDARKQQGDLQGALAAFRRAVELEPEYGFAGASLFDLAIEAEDLATAEHTLEVVGPHLRGGWQAAMGVRLAARRRDLPAARAALAAACTAADDPGSALHDAIGRMERAGWLQEAEAAIQEAMARDDARPEAAAAWVECRTRRKLWDCGERIAGLWHRGEMGTQAAAAFVGALARAGRKRQMRRFVRDNAERLRSSAHTWGTVVYSLLQIGDVRPAIDWSADWERVPGVRPWMLVNRAEALRCVGREQEGAAVSEAAMAMRPDNGTPLHALWLASDAAVAGQTSRAMRWLGAADLEDVHAYYRVLHAIVHAAVQVQEAAPAERAATFARVRGELEGQWRAGRERSTPREERQLARVYRRAARRMAADVGTIPARLWALRQQLAR